MGPTTPAAIDLYFHPAVWAHAVKATEWAMVRCEDRYHRRVAELSGGVPLYDGGDAVAIAAE